MSDPIAISVKNVSKNFKLPHQKTSSIKDIFVRPLQALRGGKTVEVQHALKDISFNVKQGEFFGIVGRNGSGKSTLLKILAEIYQPTSGEVSVKGRLVPFIELGVGFNPELTGRENVYLSGALNGFSEKEIDEMYDDIVEFAELEQFMDQKLKNYSSGMQVRLAFSMATRAKADILLIDEVLAVGDADFQRKCFAYFKELKKNKKTVVFVSHDMEAVREYCDRALLVNQGYIEVLGKTDQVAVGYMKLFNKSGRQGDESGERWGNQKLETLTAKVDVTEDTVTIKQSVVARAAVKNVVVGIRIRGANGQSVTGTNTKLEHQVIPELGEGKEAEFMWRLPNVFGDGKYLLDLALHEDDGITVIEWFDEAVRFDVMRDRRIPYVMDAGFEFNHK